MTAGELGMGGCTPSAAREEEEDPAAAKGSPFKALQAGLGPPHDCEADRDPGSSGNLGQSLPLSLRLLSPGSTVTWHISLFDSQEAPAPSGFEATAVNSLPGVLPTSDRWTFSTCF